MGGRVFQRFFKMRKAKSDRIAFLHIPKSAGSSISIGLENSAFTNTAWGLFDETFFGGFSDFDSLQEATRKRLVHLPGTHIDPNWEAVSGHMALPTIKRLFPRHRIFTVLREPRTRLVSHWLFWRALGDEERSKWGNWTPRIALADGPLGSFIQTPEIASHTDNITVRMLLGPHPLIPLEGFIDPSSDERLLKEARLALEGIELVGITEDRLLNSKISAFTGHDFELPRVNVTEHPVKSRPDVSREFSENVMALLLARSRLDRALWIDAAKPIFDSPEATADAAFIKALFRHMG